MHTDSVCTRTHAHILFWAQPSSPSLSHTHTSGSRGQRSQGVLHSLPDTSFLYALKSSLLYLSTSCSYTSTPQVVEPLLYYFGLGFGWGIRCRFVGFINNWVKKMLKSRLGSRQPYWFVRACAERVAAELCGREEICLLHVRYFTCYKNVCQQWNNLCPTWREKWKVTLVKTAFYFFLSRLPVSKERGSWYFEPISGVAT